MTAVLIKRASPGALVIGSLPGKGELATDIELDLGPDDVIEGRKVSEWPTGVHDLPDSALNGRNK